MALDGLKFKMYDQYHSECAETHHFKWKIQFLFSRCVAPSPHKTVNFLSPLQLGDSINPSPYGLPLLDK